MPSKTFWSLVIVCLAVSAATAQDPTKVEPKHYKLGFENEHVQVVYVHYGPHEKSVMHDHPGGVVVYVTEGHLKFTDPNGKSPFKHRVENLGEKPFDAVYVGVKTKTTIKVE
jgi:hypothetical protein